MTDRATAQKVLEHFVVERKPYKVIPLQQGYINLTYKVLDGERVLYLLQRINTHVFPDIDALMQNLLHILPYLDRQDYHAIALFPTKARTPFYKNEDGTYWRLMTFVPDSVSYDTTEESDIAFEAGKILGIFHSALHPVSPGKLKEVIPDFHKLPKRSEEFEQALKVASKERIARAAEEIEIAHQYHKILKGYRPEGLSVRICHNDTKLNNFLFSKSTGKGLCLIDLDTVMPGYMHFDLGDAIRTIANPCPEEEKVLERISFNLDLVEAFLKGLRESMLPLTVKEKGAIPYGAVLMPYIHGLRALTDYLNNDKYYQVSYSEQNRDRSASLFSVAQKAYENRNEISGLVKRILG
jgi:Ser/Thr protein kinase RdoA (MazF antagonist)